MDKSENFFGWLLRRRRGQPSTKKSHQPVRVAPYRPLDDLDKIIAELKVIQADFDDMIASSEKVLTSLTKPRPYMTREDDKQTWIA